MRRLDVNRVAVKDGVRMLDVLVAEVGDDRAVGQVADA